MKIKPKLLYASPFPPKRSGISDYSSVLVKALSSKFEIILYTDNYEIMDESLKDYRVVKYQVDDIDFDEYDYRIYNIGNNPEYHQYIYEASLKYPGMVILHDLVLYYLFVGYYQDRSLLYSSVYSKLGLKAFLTLKKAVKENGNDLLAQKQMPSRLPMNSELIASGNKIMVHSEYAKSRIVATGLIDSNLVRHINLIEQIDANEKIVSRDELFRKYNVPTDAIIISSFGYIAETKRNRDICEAILKVVKKCDKRICYVMVGQGDYADSYLVANQIIKTDYTELDEFNSFIQYSDIIMNLRFPSMGETSAAMLRILQTGKPCITNNGGWFSEIPDNVVCKIEIENIVENIETKLLELLENENMRNELGNRAKAYIEAEYNSDTISQQIYDFITK